MPPPWSIGGPWTHLATTDRGSGDRETAHALYWALLPDADSRLDVVCCSGRGDKDLAEVLARS